MDKRTWHYILPPTAYDMRCDKCWSGELDDDTGTNITWSEYEDRIWCYDCEIDTEGFSGIFDGPIPTQVAFMIGIHFDRFNMITKQIEKLNIETNEYDTLDVVEKTIGTDKDRLLDLLKDEDRTDPYGIQLSELGKKHFRLVPAEEHSSSKWKKKTETQ